MKYLQLSLKSEVLKGKEKEQTVLIEGWLWVCIVYNKISGFTLLQNACQ